MCQTLDERIAARIAARDAKDAQILATLAAAGGAILHWQVSDPRAWQDACDREVIVMDWDSDCYLHPLAIGIAEGGWEMPQ